LLTFGLAIAMEYVLLEIILKKNDDQPIAIVVS